MYEFIYPYLLHKLQTNIQVLQLADVASGTNWLYGHVLSHQCNIFFNRHNRHAVTDNSSPL